MSRRWFSEPSGEIRGDFGAIAESSRKPALRVWDVRTAHRALRGVLRRLQGVDRPPQADLARPSAMLAFWARGTCSYRIRSACSESFATLASGATYTHDARRLQLHRIGARGSRNNAETQAFIAKPVSGCQPRAVYSLTWALEGSAVALFWSLRPISCCPVAERRERDPETLERFDMRESLSSKAEKRSTARVADATAQSASLRLLRTFENRIDQVAVPPLTSAATAFVFC